MMAIEPKAGEALENGQWRFPALDKDSVVIEIWIP